MNNSFATGQLVWAKIKGKAWWPAVVTQNHKGTDAETEVDFVGETLSATVNDDNIADFDAKFKEHSKNKGKKFQEVLKIALDLAKKNPSSQEAEKKPQQQKEQNIPQSVEAAPVEAVPAKRGRGRPKKNPEPAEQTAMNVEVSSRPPSANKEAKKSARKAKSPKVKDNSENMSIEEHKEKEVSLDDEKTVAVAPIVVPERMTRSHVKKGSMLQQIMAEPLPPTARKGRKTPAKKEQQEMKVEAPSGRKGRRASASAINDEKSVSRTQTEMRQEVASEWEVPKAIQTLVNSQTGRKEKKATAQKEAKKNTATKNQPEEIIQEIVYSKETKDKERKVIAPVIDFESRPLPLKSQLPLPEKFQPRNLLVSITAEPSVQNHIEVTTRKRTTRSSKTSVVASQAKSSVPMKKGVTMTQVKNSTAMSQLGNSSKRSSFMWYKDVPPTVYLTHDKMKHHRNVATDYIVKKVKGSQNFQERMSSIKGTKLKDIQSDRNWVSKARVAYNSLMIKKFENDLEILIGKLVKKFKNGEALYDSDEEHAKVLNIIVEFERNKFNGSELTSSDIGKLLKTLHGLLLNNKQRISGDGNMLVSMVAKVLHKIKDNILRFCLDNSDYVESFGMNEGLKGSPGGTEVIDIDRNEKFSFDKATRMALDNETIAGLGMGRNGLLDGMVMNDRDHGRPLFLQQEHHGPLYFSGEGKNSFGELALPPNQPGSDKSLTFHSNFTSL